MANQESRYYSFLLRLWLVDDNGKSAIRATLEFPLTGKCKSFSDLDDLCSYLRLLTKIELEEIRNETSLF